MRNAPVWPAPVVAYTAPYGSCRIRVVTAPLASVSATGLRSPSVCTYVTVAAVRSGFDRVITSTVADHSEHRVDVMSAHARIE